jgi:hypothetical protein
MTYSVIANICMKLKDLTFSLEMEKATIRLRILAFGLPTAGVCGPSARERRRESETIRPLG